MRPIEIVYKHQDFIIIDKPCGISVHKDDREIGLTTQVAWQLGVEKLWLVHRLDKITSGLLIFALNEQSAVSFGRIF
ncbi:RNA pseudouridylate synthase [Cricetibacter osteomyelitidis]|uniref:RNA pseudouridylate synthase n=1 Tax=Cricetibacter osteomyelitidis TaxID=1521931 RepID=A0A4R2TB17_9PAST|nr:RNA pseudouridylate synthase [Cricetibacter osteomyelitidis]